MGKYHEPTGAAFFGMEVMTARQNVQHVILFEVAHANCAAVVDHSRGGGGGGGRCGEGSIVRALGLLQMRTGESRFSLLHSSS